MLISKHFWGRISFSFIRSYSVHSYSLFFMVEIGLNPPYAMGEREDENMGNGFSHIFARFDELRSKLKRVPTRKELLLVHIPPMYAVSCRTMMTYASMWVKARGLHDEMIKAGQRERILLCRGIPGAKERAVPRPRLPGAFFLFPRRRPQIRHNRICTCVDHLEKDSSC